MTTYSYAQLESLWLQAGGSQALAPVMAAIALAESGGRSDAYNPSGASGLWQILGAVNPSDQGSLFNAQVNAKEAVLKYRTQGLGAWVTYTSGAYRQYLQSNIAPTPSGKLPLGQQLTQLPPGGQNNSTSNQQSSAPVPTNIGGVLSGATGLLRDVATVLDYVFGMFGRGQGWRMVFTLISAAALFASYKALVAAGAVPAGFIPSRVPVI